MENIGTAGHLGFSTPSPAVELENVLTVTKYGSSSKPSVNQTLFFRSIEYFRIP